MITNLGPFLAIEQPMLAESVGSRQRNLAFARYSLSGAVAGAGGGLAATLATDVRISGLFFLLYALIGLLTAALPLLLSARVEAAVASLERRLQASAGTEAILLRFRLESTRAVLRFVDGLLDATPELRAVV